MPAGGDSRATTRCRRALGRRAFASRRATSVHEPVALLHLSLLPSLPPSLPPSPFLGASHPRAAEYNNIHYSPTMFGVHCSPSIFGGAERFREPPADGGTPVGRASPLSPFLSPSRPLSLPLSLAPSPSPRTLLGPQCGSRPAPCRLAVILGQPAREGGGGAPAAAEFHAAAERRRAWRGLGVRLHNFAPFICTF